MKKSYNTIDIAKFLCSIGIVALHIPPVESSSSLLPYINFITSLCVPLFFIFSSYLFFNNRECVAKTIDIKKFTLRISTLYICWLLINLIINFDHTKTNNLIINLILGNTFPGSWFYSALVVSTLIVFILSKIKNICLILFSLSIYIYITLNFSGLLQATLFDWYQSNIYIVFLSLPYALIWTTIGYLINVNKNKDLITLNIILVISFILLSFIYKSAIIEIVSWYIRLILSEIIAYVCINYNLKLSLPYKYLRNMSTLIFMIHFSFLYRLPDYYLYHINLKFFIVTLFSLVASTIIIQLSKFKYLTMLHRLY